MKAKKCFKFICIYQILLLIHLSTCVTIKGESSEVEFLRPETSISEQILQVWSMNTDCDDCTFQSKIDDEVIKNHLGFRNNGHKMKFIPSNLWKIFPSLKWLKLEKSNLTEIHKAEIENFKNLVVLELMQNYIEKIEMNLFINNVNLELIDLSLNKIKFIESSAFNGLQSLSFLRLVNNVCISYDANGQENIQNFIKSLSHECRNELKDLKEENQALKVQQRILNDTVMEFSHEFSEQLSSRTFIIAGCAGIFLIALIVINLIVNLKMKKNTESLLKNEVEMAKSVMNLSSLPKVNSVDEVNNYNREEISEYEEIQPTNEVENEYQDFEWDEMPEYSTVDLSKKCKNKNLE